MIVKKEKKGNILIYTVEKDFDDAEMAKRMSRQLTEKDISYILRKDADVYTTDGKLLLRFRKNKLSKKNIDRFFENIIQFAMMKTSNRGSASASKSRNVRDNPKIMSNIIGYFDKMSPSQKMNATRRGISTAMGVRETRFTADFPEKYAQTIPLIEEIDHFYKKYIPEQYKLQKKKANQTPFHISNTAFTTVTTNVNYQTAVHTDKGDDEEGFGNLAVIERGSYTGGETCFPQYGIGVDVRTGDVLYMDVHQAHGNLPVKLKTPDAVRLSIVCYLRRQIWLKTRGKSKTFMTRHLNKIRNITKKQKQHSSKKRAQNKKGREKRRTQKRSRQ